METENKINESVNDLSMVKYRTIDLEEILKYMVVTRKYGNSIYLVPKDYRTKKMKEIRVNIPFVLNEEVARFCGLLFDGCITNFAVYFAQRKFEDKHDLFINSLHNLFGIKSIHTTYNGKDNKTRVTTISSRSLSYFLQKVLDCNSSKEEMRIPNWIFSSPQNIVRAYLQEAYLMEGGICEPTTGKKEIRFHTCDRRVTKDLARILNEKFGITTVLTTYKVPNYGLKFCISISKLSEIKKFASEIGFNQEPHKSRLNYLLNNVPFTATESTLYLLAKLNKTEFTPHDLHIEKLDYPLINWRLKQLVKLGLCKKQRKNIYILTEEGKIKLRNLAFDRKKKVRYNRLSKENITFIKRELQKGKSFASISRKLNINFGTIRLNKSIQEFIIKRK